MNEPVAAHDLSQEALLGQVADEFTERLKRGEQPDLEEYARQYPEIADLLRQVLPVLQVMGPGSLDPVSLGDRLETVEPMSGCLGDFRLQREVGRGGMGVVYEANQISLDRRVALKVLPFASALDSKQLLRFKNEAQAAAHLHHQNIVPVYYVGCERGVHFYAMQFIEGHTLAAVIRDLRQEAAKEDRGSRIEDRGSKVRVEAATIEDRGPTNETRPSHLRSALLDPQASIFRMVANLGVQAAEALDYAHRQEVIHRDIKPANLLVDAQGNLWITDFGLARFHGEAALTLSGDLVGTLRYMSPEQALAKRGLVDHRTDVYSLGATLYELLTLEPAFAGRDRHELLRQIAWEEPPSPRRLNKAIPAELETIVLKAMSKNPAERYGTARELADDLRRFLEHKPIRAKRPTYWQRLKKWAWRHQSLVVTAGVSAVLMLVLGVVALAVSNVMISREQEQTEKALRAEQQARDDLAHTVYYQRIAMAERARTANNHLVAEELLDKCEPAFRGWEWHYLRRLRQGKPPGLQGGPDLAFSPDDRRLAAPHENDVRIWDVATRQEIVTLHGHTGRVFRIAFSPDGRWLASASQDKTVKLWDMATGRETFTLRGHPERVIGLAFAPDSRSLASISADQTVYLWNPADGKELHRFPGPGSSPGLLGRRRLGVAFSPDSRCLAAGHEGNSVKIWDTATGSETLSLLGHSEPVVYVVFSPDGRYLASAGGDDMVRVWDLTQRQEMFAVRSIRTLSDAAAFSPDSRRVTVTNEYGRLRVYDVGTGQEVFLGGRSGITIWSVTYSPDGSLIATVSGDGVGRVYNAATGQERVILAGHVGGGLECVAFTHDSQRIATGSVEDGTVRLWDGRPWEEDTDPRILVLRGHTGPIGSVAFSPDGRLLATASRDQSVKIWNAATGQVLRTLSGHADAVRRVVFSPDGQLLASCSMDLSVRLWETATGREVRKFANVTGGWHLVFSPDGRRLVTDKSLAVTVLDASTGQTILSLPGHDVDIGNVAYSGDGKYLASAGHDRKVIVWNALTGNMEHVLLGHTSKVQSVAFSPDSRLVATGGMDSVRIWDPVKGVELVQCQRERFGPCYVTFSPNGRRVAATSLSGLGIWDPTTGRMIESIGGFAGMIGCMAFSPDGQRLAVASGYSGHGEVRVVPVTPLGPAPE